MRVSVVMITLFAMGLAQAGDMGSHEEAAMQWRAQRDASLRKPDGWLSLIGLHWLEEGRSTVGSAANNDVVLAAGPASVGELSVADGQVTFCPASPEVTVGGATVECAELASDATGDPTLVRFGSVQFYVIDREGALGLRVKDAQAATLQAFEGMEYFPYAPQWRVDARFIPNPDGSVIELPNVLGTVEYMANPGQLVFEHDGREFTLQAAQYEGDDELFLIFGDRTNSKTTYGAGRFVYTPLPDADNRVAIDFNRAYNPPCVFTPYATCPLPPPGNRLDVAIEAGELNYADGVH